nr:hypothetical protein [Mycobacterium colombiense]
MKLITGTGAVNMTDGDPGGADSGCVHQGGLQVADQWVEEGGPVFGVAGRAGARTAKEPTVARCDSIIRAARPRTDPIRNAGSPSGRRLTHPA